MCGTRRIFEGLNEDEDFYECDVIIAHQPPRHCEMRGGMDGA
jgi:hypothetical protein